MSIWAAQWRSRNRLDGYTRHLCYENCLPVLFHTRKECRKFIESRYGYIAERPDLQEEPHGWMMPLPIKVTIDPVYKKFVRR